MSEKDLMIALDYSDARLAMACVRGLDGLPVVFKIGLELFMSEGPSLVKKLKEENKRIFLDLKLHDIPNTVTQAALKAAQLGVDFLTIHLASGRKAFESVFEAFENLEAHQSRPMILGVSVLTSFDDPTWKEYVKTISKDPYDAERSVYGLAKKAQSWGLKGIVCSPREVKKVRKLCPDLYLAVPGIRPQGTEAQDQARVMTPKEAVSLGASGIVVGRPITQAKSPREMAEKILEEIHGC